MNYIREINAFYDLVQVKQLSTGQIALWHALMQINNKCSWIEWFTAPNLTLELTTGLSRKGIYNARNTLKQHGLIDFKSNGTRATSYKLMSLLNNTQDSTQETTQGKSTMQDITQDTTQVTTQDTTQGTTQSSATLTKLKETKLKETKTSSGGVDIAKIANEFQQNGFGTINLTVKEMLIDLVENYPEEWILNAMKVAVKNNARRLNYVEGILRRWNNSGGMKLGGRQDESDTNSSKRDSDELAKRAGITIL